MSNNRTGHKRVTSLSFFIQFYVHESLKSSDCALNWNTPCACTKTNNHNYTWNRNKTNLFLLLLLFFELLLELLRRDPQELHVPRPAKRQNIGQWNRETKTRQEIDMTWRHWYLLDKGVNEFLAQRHDLVAEFSWKSHRLDFFWDFATFVYNASLRLVII